MTETSAARLDSNVTDESGTMIAQSMTRAAAMREAQSLADVTGTTMLVHTAFPHEEPTRVEPMPYRAYDTTTEWSGSVRSTIEAAEADADRHNRGCVKQGGYGSAEVVTRDPEAPSRLVDLGGRSVWPPHGRSCGAARWLDA